MIFKYGDEVYYPSIGGRGRGWVCKPPTGYPAPPYYDGGAFVLGKVHNIPMWFDETVLELISPLDRMAEEL